MTFVTVSFGGWWGLVLTVVTFVGVGEIPPGGMANPQVRGLFGKWLEGRASFGTP